MLDADTKNFVREIKALGEQLVEILYRVKTVPFPIKDCKVASVDLAIERLPCGHPYLVVSFKLADPVHKEVIGLMEALDIAQTPDVEIHEGTLGKDH